MAGLVIPLNQFAIQLCICAHGERAAWGLFATSGGSGPFLLPGRVGMRSGPTLDI